MISSVTSPWQRQLVALVVAQFSAVIGFSCFHPFLALYVQELGIEGRSDAAAFVGVMLFLNSTVLAVLAPVWGAFADRIGPKMMAQRALIGSAVLCAAMALARTPTELLLGYCALGAVSGVIVALTTLASAVTPLGQVGRAIGFMQAAVFTAMAVGPLAAGIAANVVGYRQLFYVGGAFVLLGGLLVTCFVQPPVRPGTAAPPILSSLRTVGKDRPVVAITVLVFLLQVGSVGANPVIPIFVQELEANPEAVNTIVGLAFGLSGLTGSIGAVWNARLAERFGHGVALTGIAALGALFQLPHIIAANAVQLVLFRGMFGTVHGGYLPITGAMTARVVPPERRGVAYGLTGAAFALGNGIGPLVMGASVALVGVRGVFALEAAILAVAAIGAHVTGGALMRKMRAAGLASEAAA